MIVQMDSSIVDKIAEDLQEGGFKDHKRSGFLIGRINDNGVFVEGIFVPEQESSPKRTYISPETEARSFEKIRALGREVVGLGHYYNHLDVSESEADYAARMSCVKKSVPALAIITNSSGDYKILLD